MAQKSNHFYKVKTELQKRGFIVTESKSVRLVGATPYKFDYYFRGGFTYVVYAESGDSNPIDLDLFLFQGNSGYIKDNSTDEDAMVVFAPTMDRFLSIYMINSRPAGVSPICNILIAAIGGVYQE